MNNYNDLILKYQSGEMTIPEREEFNRNFFLSEELRKEFLFQEKLGKVMKKNLFLEGIESDPNLIKAEILALQDIDNYLNNSNMKNIRMENKTINIETEVEIRKKIAKAEVEMVLSGIDDLAEEWVRDFELRKPAIQGNVSAQHIFDYISKNGISLESDIQIPAVSRHISRKIIFQAAAAVFILSLLLFKALTPGFSGDSVYKNYYEPLESNSFQFRGSAQEVSSKLQEGVDYYLSKDYNKAELAFNNLRKIDSELPELLLYSGLNHMGKNNFKAAIPYFSYLLILKNKFVPEAQWYLGLCYFKTGDLSNARLLMATVSESEGIYKNKAFKILKSLNQ